MKRVACSIFSIIVTAAIVTICYAEEIEYSIVSSLPTPGPSTQGLAWDGTHLWVSDDSTDTIYKINSSDGVVIESFIYPDSDPKGLTWDGLNLWSVFGSTNNINKLNPENGEILRTLDAVFNEPDESFPIHGLTWDGANLLCSYFAGWSSAVIKIHLTDGAEHVWFYCDAEDITFDGKFLWNVGSYNGNHKGVINKRDLPLGTEIAYFRTPGNYPTGLTWDGMYLWLSDCETDTIYQIEPLTTMVESDSSHAPFILSQNYPNPFNPVTTLKYYIASPSHVTLNVYSITGQKVATLVDGTVSAGEHSVKFDGSNLASGIYLYIFTSKGFEKTGKMILMK